MSREPRPPNVFRDMSLYHMDDGRVLVTACDAAGGIGQKWADVEPATPESVGYFCARVSLLELLTLRVTLCSVSCTLSVEREPTGMRLLTGVRQQLREESLDHRTAFTVSSENNFPCVQTGLGVTMTGLTHVQYIPWRACRPPDRVALIGSRLLGRQARFGHPAMVRPSTIRGLVAHDEVREVIPIGSGGVRGELAQLEARGIRIDAAGGSDPTGWSDSGGPATAALVVASPEFDLATMVARLQPEAPFEWIGQVADVDRRAAT